MLVDSRQPVSLYDRRVTHVGGQSTRSCGVELLSSMLSWPEITRCWYDGRRSASVDAGAWPGGLVPGQPQEISPKPVGLPRRRSGRLGVHGPFRDEPRGIRNRTSDHPRGRENSFRVQPESPALVHLQQTHSSCAHQLDNGPVSSTSTGRTRLSHKPAKWSRPIERHAPRRQKKNSSIAAKADGSGAGPPMSFSPPSNRSWTCRSLAIV